MSDILGSGAASAQEHFSHSSLPRVGRSDARSVSPSSATNGLGGIRIVNLSLCEGYDEHVERGALSSRNFLAQKSRDSICAA